MNSNNASHIRFVIAVCSFCFMVSAVQSEPNIWINEFHYDNEKADLNEFVEVVVPASFSDLVNVTLSLYNGSDSSVYETHTLDTFTPGMTVNDLLILYKFIEGIQNGGPDGFCLSYGGDETVIQFISYEGEMTATKGPADGLTSEDVLVEETSSTQSDQSLQLLGNGTSYEDFTWGGPATSSPGEPNGDQTLPVFLSSFTADYVNEVVELLWRTQSEKDNAGFFVYRSQKQDEDYVKISPFIQGAGTATQAKTYRFIDRRVEPETTYWYKLYQQDYDGSLHSFGPISVSTITSGGAMRESLCRKSKLISSYPNPFNPRTEITFYISERDIALPIVDLAIYDVLGRKVKTLDYGNYAFGEQQVTWDGSDDAGRTMPAGMYFCRMTTSEGAFSFIKLIKAK